jgi:hypothetical protein
MTTRFEQSDRLNALMLSSVDGERVHLTRNVAYGGAAVSLAVLAGLTQVGASALSLRMGVYAAAVTLPIWLLLGTMYEYYIYLGPGSYAHLASPFILRLSLRAFAAAGLGLVATSACIIWYLAPGAALVFIGMSLACCVVAARFHFDLAQWWFSQGGARCRSARSKGMRASKSIDVGVLSAGFARVIAAGHLQR